MSLQSKTIQRYRLFFPSETLREVSSRTGIQITRVHRLLKGKPMKVEELEAFQSAVDYRLADKPQHSRLDRIMEEASYIFTDAEIGKISDYIERKIMNKNLGRIYSPEQELQSAIIA